MPTESKDTIFNPQIPKNNKGRRVSTFLLLLYLARRPRTAVPDWFRIGSGWFKLTPAGSD